MKLSPIQIAVLASQAGFTGQDVATAVAVALAESGGNPQAYNPETAAGTPPGKGSYGLWQIYLQAHPEFGGLNLYDPASNALAARTTYHNAGSSFRPWSTFKSGAYTTYMSKAAQAVAALNGGGDAQPPDAAEQPC